MGLLSYGYKALKAGAKRKKVSPTITSIKPTFPKTVRQKNSRDLKQFGRMVKAKTKKMGDDVSLKVNEISQKLKKIREPKMGGGMMGRQMYKKGGKSFPDLTGDGKVTKKDILRGRGVPGFSIGGGVGKLKNKLKTTKGKPKIIRTDIKKEFGIKNLDKDKNNAKN